jgi:hypothetical protein
MIPELKKRVFNKKYRLKLIFKSLFLPKNYTPLYHSIEKLSEEFKEKDKIIVFCSGPSANKAIPSKNYLYLATNDGYKFMVKNNLDFLFYLGDPNYVRKNLVIGNKYLKKKQPILSFYSQTELHKRDWNYIKNKLWMFKNFNLYSSNYNAQEGEIPKSNYDKLYSFYQSRGLPIKIQNSGVFLLLFGYYLAVTMNKPLEIYGLDLGIGGNLHYDKKGFVTKSITRDRVKENVKMYLDYIYNNHPDVKNYSNFYGNMTDYKLD